MTRTHRGSSSWSIRIITFITILASSAFAQTVGKAVPTHEALWIMKRVGAPSLSPDGRWVVFQVTEPSYTPSDQVADYWIVPSDGSAKPRRLTATRATESDASWSPDSRRIAFSSKREGDEVTQIYVIDLAGGEAIRITNAPTGARKPVWSPDGSMIAFTSNVYPGGVDDETNKKIAAERKERKYNARVYETFPIRLWDKWRDDMIPTLFVQTAEPKAVSRNLFAGSSIAAGPGFGARNASGSAEELDAVWAPDGQSLIFNATITRNQAAYSRVEIHLFQVPVGGGEITQLTRAGGSFSRPAFRPDNKALYALHEPAGKMIYHHDRLVAFGWPALGEPKNVTATLDRSVQSFAFTPDSKTILLTAEDAGLEKVYTVPASGGKVQLLIEPKHGVYTGITSAAKAKTPIFIANWQSSIDPAEVVRLEPARKTHVNLSDFAVEAAAAVDWQPPRHFTFKSDRGREIHSMLFLPAAFDESKKYPLVVLMHGGPHSMWRDAISLRWNYHLIASPGYVVLATNYTGSTGFSEQFAQQIQGDPLAGPGSEVNQAADEAIRRFPFIDASRQAAGGASYGGHLANWLLATTTRYRCLFSHAGLMNLESQWATSDTIFHREVTAGGPPWEGGQVWKEHNPIRFAMNFKTPMLLSVGENDFRVPLNQTIEAWSALQRMQVPSKLMVFPDENHWILKGENSRFFYQQLLGWLEMWLAK